MRQLILIVAAVFLVSATAHAQTGPKPKKGVSSKRPAPKTKKPIRSTSPTVKESKKKVSLGTKPATHKLKGKKDKRKVSAKGKTKANGTSSESSDDIGKCERKPTLKAKIASAKKSKKLKGNLELDQERRDYNKAVKRYVRAAEDYRGEARTMLKSFIEKRRNLLTARYDRVLNRARTKSKSARLAAIEKFKAFIKKYPRNAKHTPDAMFRLAELYYERSEGDHDNLSTDWEKKMDLYERGKIPSRPEEPTKRYADTIKAYRLLISRFGSKYRYADAVHYHLGFLLHRTGAFKKARVAWNDLVARYPKSKFAPDVLVLMGNLYFDTANYPKAIAYYKRALAYPNGQYYDKALYQLAWSHGQRAVILEEGARRIESYDLAIKKFLELIAWYDADKVNRRSKGDSLRSEAIEYVGKTLQDPDWDGDGEPDQLVGLARAQTYLNQGKAYEPEIMESFANALFETYDTKLFAEALKVYRLMIGQAPEAPEAGKYQKRIIQILDGMQKGEEASLARAKLAEMFRKGSKWYEANKENPKIIALADRAVEKALRERAGNHHKKAETLRDQARLKTDKQEAQALLQKALYHYRQASEAYKDYLARYPKVAMSYDFRFYLAETYFYSARYKKAVAAYEVVAKMPYKTEHRETSAGSIVTARERIIARLVRTGRLKKRADPNTPWREPEKSSKATAEKKKKKKRFAKRKVKSVPMPRALRAWFKAVDFYINNDMKSDGKRKIQAELAYLSAEMAFRYKNYPEARRRYKLVLACFPKTVMAANALANIINTYRAENDFANLEKWANIAQTRDIGDPKVMAKIRKEVKMFKLSARFEHANQLFKQKKFLAAAREFEKMAKDHPDNAEAAKAFFNAAQGYNKAKYYDSSSRLFEKLVMDPKYKNNPFKADSLINLANNYKLFFQFGKAIIAYKAFFDRYPNSDDRAYALQEAGQLQEKNGDLRQAAKTFEKYADTFPEKKDAPAAFFAAGLLYERLRDSDEQDRIWRLYIKRFGSKLGQDGFVLRAMSKQAALAKKRGRLTKTIKKWKDIIREFERRGQAPNTPSAAAAAQAKFSLLEREFKAYAKLRLKGGLKRQRAVLAKKNKRLIELTQRYAEVFPYKRFEWTICALFRQGDLYREFAKTLYAMPEPKGEKQDVIDEWRNTVEDMGLKYENIAVSKFAITVDKSRQLNVTGRCARQALEAINKYQPEKYPLFKEEKRRFVYKSVYTVDGSAKDLQKKK